MKKFNILIVSIISTLFTFSCTNDDIEGSKGNDPEYFAKNTAYAFKTSSESSFTETRGVGLRGKYWAAGQTVRIKFLNDGYQKAKDEVMQYAAEWLQYANLNFEYVDKSEDADVKIAFNWNNDRSAWSEIGKNSLAIAQDQPSMNIPNEGTYYGVSRTIVLREFGHVLGLAFEHQNPQSSFNWIENSVYTYFIQQGWTEDNIRKFIFTTYSLIRTNSTEFDDNSIMLLYLPPFLTSDWRETPWNTELSSTDKSFIQQLYPGR